MLCNYFRYSKLKSVTCTNEDIEQAEYLADLSKLDMERIGPKILAAEEHWKISL